ncbi:hypothetical protein IAD21_04326 [Abditibacteriota bacterium]|nr:hypothetical protein IAD21_04326 [Abditibacteriota bacterium]
MKQTSFLLLSAFIVGGCSQTTPPAPPPSAQSQTKAAQTLVDAMTGDAPASRDNARALRRQSDALLATKNYTGAMDKRLQMLALRSNDSSTLGALTYYAIQSLALGDIEKIASHLDAASCGNSATRLEKIDAQIPTYTLLLQREKASELKRLTQLSGDSQKWNRTIAGLGRTPQEQQTLNNMSVAQIAANISTVYDAAIERATQPYSMQEIKVSTDPYTRTFATPSRIGRFLWTKFKTERVLLISALAARDERRENRTLSLPMLSDPFGNGPLKEKKGVVYSVGPDTKDNGGKSVPSPNRVQPSDKGDLLAPTF